MAEWSTLKITTGRPIKERGLSMDLRSKVRELKEVSTIPVIHQKVLKVLEDELSTTSDIQEVIEHDQSIASKVLGMANAAFYGQSRKVDTISQAIYILGLDMVKAIALSVTVFDLMKFKGMDLRELWVHSFRVGIASLLLGEERGERKEALFTAGLIHDLGRAILCQIFEGEYVKVWRLTADLLLKEEERLFGAPHTLVGSWFIDGYLFPEEFAICIRHHHSPAGGGSLLPYVFIADCLVSRDEKGGDTLPLPTNHRVLQRIGVDEKCLERVRSTLKEMEEDILHFYGML